jgi:hypothetical protein
MAKITEFSLKSVATPVAQNISQAASSATAAGASTLVKSSYVDVGGLYYEIHGAVHGADKPLVLLHGGFGNIPSWGPTLTARSVSGGHRLRLGGARPHR